MLKDVYRVTRGAFSRRVRGYPRAFAVTKEHDMAYQTVNPFNNKLIKEYPAHDDQKVQQALATAHELYKSQWAQGDIKPRLQVLHTLSELISARVEDLAKIASEEMGKLIEQSRGEVKLCAAIAKYYAEHAEEFLKPTRYPTDLGEAWVENAPIGVLVAVEPWNFPYYQLMRVLAPNLAAGNSILVKHASIVPHCAEVFEQLVHEAGAPEGAYTNLFISTDQVGNLIDDDRVQGVALTGSEKAGSIVAARGNGNAARVSAARGRARVLRYSTASAVLKSCRGALRAAASATGRRRSFWFMGFALWIAIARRQRWRTVPCQAVAIAGVEQGRLLLSLDMGVDSGRVSLGAPCWRGQRAAVWTRTQTGSTPCGPSFGPG